MELGEGEWGPGTAESPRHLPFIPNDPSSKDPALSCSAHQEKLQHSLLVFSVSVLGDLIVCWNEFEDSS